MEMPRWVVALAIILVVLNVLDILTTKVALSVGCEESNAYAIAMFATFGFAIGIFIKLGAVTTVGSLTIYSYHLDCRVPRAILTTCLISMVCLYVAVVCNNIISILR